MLAHGIAFDIFPHKLCKIQPPELSSDKLVSFEMTGVTSSLMVMAVDKDGAAERILQRDVDTTFVCEDVVIVFPVREMRPEGGRDVLQG